VPDDFVGDPTHPVRMLNRDSGRISPSPAAERVRSLTPGQSILIFYLYRSNAMDTQLSSRSHPVTGPLALPLAPVPLF
jgi:hypothetical protein